MAFGSAFQANAFQKNAFQVGRNRGDDALGIYYSGEARRFFYDKQIEEARRTARKAVRRPKKERAVILHDVFEPFLRDPRPADPVIEIIDAIAQLDLNRISDEAFRTFIDSNLDLLARYNEQRRRQNNDAAIALLLAA